MFFPDYLSRCTQHNVQWTADGIPFDGRPFVIVGRQHLQCRSGPLQHKKKLRVNVVITVTFNLSSVMLRP